MALGLLSSIVNTRFLSPNDYGDVRYVQNIMQFVAIFLLVGFFHSGARLLAQSKDEVYNRKIKGVMMLVLLVSCIIISMSMLACSFLHLDKPSVAHLFVISVPVAWSPILLNYIEQTMLGDNQIGRLSLARLLPYLIYVPLGFCIYNVYGATSSLMQTLQLGVFSTIYLVVILSTRPIFKDIRPIWQELRKENRKFGSHLYYGSLVMVASNYLAGISLGYFNTDNSEVGFYTLALTLASPLITLPAIIGTIQFKNFASLDAIPAKLFKFTVVITIVTFLLFLLLIHPAVIYLYSQEYAIVARYATLLAIGYCLHGLGDMINRFLASHGLGKEIRNASFANGVMKIFGFTVLVALFNTNGAIATTIICDIIYLAFMLYYYISFVKKGKHDERA